MPSEQRSFDFEAGWNELSQHLRGLLARRGVTGWLADDIVQETALRLWDRRARIDTSRPIEPLANTIALNLLRDHARAKKHLVEVASSPEERIPIEVEDEVLARDELHRARVALGKLRSNYQSALLGTVSSEGQVPASMRMMKMRARVQLRALMNDVSRLRSGFGLALHRSWDAIRVRISPSSGRFELMVRAMTAAVVIATSSIASMPHHAGGDPDGRGPTGKPRPLTMVTATTMLEAPRAGWKELISEATIDPAAAKRKLGRALVRVGPVAWHEGDSIASGTLMVQPDRIDGEVRLGRRWIDRVCRAALAGNCKETL